MVFRTCTFIVLAFSAVLVAGDSPSSLGFLKPDSTYVITFAGSTNAFTETQTSVNLGSVLKDKAPPVQTTIVHKIDHFVVKELGSANWVLLEHPSDLFDASKWNGKLAAESLLNADYISELEKKEGGPQQIKWLRSQAAQEIPSVQTWVNLSHALSIAPPAKKPNQLKVRVNATYNPPNKN
ncbi:hypothetical protein Poly51_63530 [Rubripirellula tenax]|uniref:Uncharacterized protein n=1 Tax=Rubripirellula tenax TaxID=2528015 RepID=A0A5C6E2H3_9BACT|nr:hypothetical protein [Rubripirellula tenax]TWU42925.1 hypothetical protein Poly51_63530 [Rubripirellula tenax]